MPIYEYRCENCSKDFEFIQKFSDKPETECPDCSGKLVKKVSLGTFHLKGSGWYKTDYADKKKEPAESPSCTKGGGCCSCPAND